MASAGDPPHHGTDLDGLYAQLAAYYPVTVGHDPTLAAAAFFGPKGSPSPAPPPRWGCSTSPTGSSSRRPPRPASPRLAQAVQRSAFPTAYDKWQQTATDWVAAITGSTDGVCPSSPYSLAHLTRNGQQIDCVTNAILDAVAAVNGPLTVTQAAGPPGRRRPAPPTPAQARPTGFRPTGTGRPPLPTRPSGRCDRVAPYAGTGVPPPHPHARPRDWAVSVRRRPGDRLQGWGRWARRPRQRSRCHPLPRRGCNVSPRRPRGSMDPAVPAWHLPGDRRVRLHQQRPLRTTHGH